MALFLVDNLVLGPVPVWRERARYEVCVHRQQGYCRKVQGRLPSLYLFFTFVSICLSALKLRSSPARLLSNSSSKTIALSFYLSLFHSLCLSVMKFASIASKVSVKQFKVDLHLVTLSSLFLSLTFFKSLCYEVCVHQSYRGRPVKVVYISFTFFVSLSVFLSFSLSHKLMLEFRAT